MQIYKKWTLDIVTKCGKCYYKMGSFLLYKTGQVVLQSRVGITEWHNFYYKMGGVVFQSGTIITKKNRIVQKDSDSFFWNILKLVDMSFH